MKMYIKTYTRSNKTRIRREIYPSNEFVKKRMLSIINLLEMHKEAAIIREDYEEAARLRDRITSKKEEYESV